MIRPLTCVCMLLAGGSGLYLYQSKHQAQMLDREITRTLKATDAGRARIRLLRDEWDTLSEPDHLAVLSQSHLSLKALMPGQYATAAELGARLPPPVTPGAVPAPVEEDTAAALPVPPPPAAVMPPAAPVPARPIVSIAKAPPVPNPLAAPLPRPPVQVASVLPLPVAPLPAPKPPAARQVLGPVVNVSVSPITTPAPRPTQARTAQPASPALGATPSRPPSPAPETSPGDSVMRVAQHVPGPGAAAQLTASGYGQPPANLVSASVLGGARPSLPPPVPYGAATGLSGANAR